MSTRGTSAGGGGRSFTGGTTGCATGAVIFGGSAIVRSTRGSSGRMGAMGAGTAMRGAGAGSGTTSIFGEGSIFSSFTCGAAMRSILGGTTTCGVTIVGDGRNSRSSFANGSATRGCMRSGITMSRAGPWITTFNEPHIARPSRLPPGGAPNRRIAIACRSAER